MNMVELIILNANLTVTITMQNWPIDTVNPFAESLIRKGFTVNRPTTVQQMYVQSGPFAAKETTTALGIEYQYRRIVMQITNNISSPQENVREVFSALSTIGYPPQESIERIDIHGTITIKIDGGNASTYVPQVVKENFVTELGNIFGRQINAIGIRLSAGGRLTDARNSPFIIHLEPLLNDPTDTKLLIQIDSATESSKDFLVFIEHLYGRLKNIIRSFKKEY